MIHIDTHGGPDDGICIIGANGDEFVPWNVVCDSLRSINIATGNNLCVVSAACFGFYVVKHNDIHKPVPFYMLVSSSKTLSFKFTEAQTFGFYKCIFEELDFIKRYNEYLASEMELFLCEKLFAVSLSRYFRFKCMGKGGKKRVEDLVTMALQGRIPPTPANLSFLRQAARQHIKPSEALFSKYASTYFIGKSPGFTFSDVIKFVRARA